ncbi:MAG TPA: tRNA (adenosine(37)-N6)-threonylcarbamoyltransferase complex ATPase subunit type 1 TsaE [Rubrobacter sp.]|nr:tRNA (adenosine(37)-N6)-threonylcarbamoyltransferase complex ATPase subunit type 1 TsaE [Rubrobacter sp.]
MAGLDEGALEDLAARVAGKLEPGDVVVLSGEVGAGKTTFVRAAARALGVRERVTSPTYQFARGYKGELGGRPVTVNHLDLYRLEGIQAPDVLEIDDYLGPDAVTFIEWARPALEAVQDPTIVHLDHEGPASRRAALRGPVAGRLSGC